MTRSFIVKHGKVQSGEMPGFSGVVRDEQAVGDGEYFDRITQPKKPPRDPEVPPMAEIRMALKSFKDFSGLIGTPAIFRARTLMENRVGCPLGCGLNFWLADDMKRHLGGHKEIVAFVELQNGRENDFAYMQDRRADRKHRLADIAAKVGVAEGESAG